MWSWVRFLTETFYFQNQRQNRCTYFEIKRYLGNSCLVMYGNGRDDNDYGRYPRVGTVEFTAAAMTVMLLLLSFADAATTVTASAMTGFCGRASGFLRTRVRLVRACARLSLQLWKAGGNSTESADLIPSRNHSCPNIVLHPSSTASGTTASHPDYFFVDWISFWISELTEIYLSVTEMDCLLDCLLDSSTDFAGLKSELDWYIFCTDFWLGELTEMNLNVTETGLKLTYWITVLIFCI